MSAGGWPDGIFVPPPEHDWIRYEQYKNSIYHRNSRIYWGCLAVKLRDRNYTVSGLGQRDSDEAAVRAVGMIPVRIRLDPDQAPVGELRAGMLVRPSIDITHNRPGETGADGSHVSL